MEYDISSYTEGYLLKTLEDVEKVFKTHFHVLLLCDVTTTVSVLRQLGHNTKPRMWTLMFHQTGHAFTDVALFDETAPNLTEVFPNVKFGYNGRLLSLYLQQNSYGYGYEIVNKRRVFGYPFRILKMLAQKMNFSYRVIAPREDDWGKNINGSWTGVFGMLQRREADFASDMLTIHLDRTAVSDYILPPIGENKRMILYKKEKDADGDHLMVFLMAFQPDVFTIFGGALVMIVVVLSSARLIHKTDEQTNHANSKNDIKLDGNTQIENGSPPSVCAKQIIMLTCFEVFGATLKQGSTNSSCHNSERILISGWWIFTTIISAVYCGAMMATFAVKLETPPFSSLAELVSRKDYTIGYDSSSITEIIIQNANLSYVVAMKQRTRDQSIKDPDLLSSNVTKHLQRVQEGKYAFITGMLILPLGRAKCQLDMLDSRLSSAYTAFHLPKSSPFKHDLQKSMHFLRDSGILHQLFQEWLQSVPEEICQEEEFPKAVSLIKIQIIFLAAGIGLGWSILILMAEIILHRTKRDICQR
ncbi:probable glutamate receptor [Haliotis cracherodii]|uniref:probable glutamate receptor n=1 Tax=Haliotis cracherodii TaxID=6455 RepID=UPI0039E96CB5